MEPELDRLLVGEDPQNVVEEGNEQAMEEEQQEGNIRHNPRMQLSEEERQHALAIKQAIEEDPDLDNLSDFQYVQFALVDQHDVEAAMHRAYHLQAFLKEEYKIRHDDIDYAMASVQTFIRQHSGVILSLAYNADEETYVLIYDLATFDQKRLQTPEDWRMFMSFVYFELTALNPDFYAIRKGVVFVCECEGFDWKNCDMKVQEKAWTELINVYPIEFRQIKYFHTGVFANLSASLMKPFLPKHIHSKFSVGNEFDGRLDTLYLVPTLEAANKRNLERFRVCLQQRFENERLFRL